MVSKIAVIALVAIVACPILIGYAFNLEQTTVTDYKESGNFIPVSNLLYNGDYYRNVNADVYQLNTNFTYYTNGTPIMPLYQSIGTTKTTFPQNQSANTYSPGSDTYYTWSDITSDFYFHVDEDPNNNVTFIDLESGVISHNQVNSIREFYYNKAENKAYYRTMSDATGSFTPYDPSDVAYFRNDGSSNVIMYVSTTVSSSPNNYVDFSGGFRTNIQFGTDIDIPDYTKSFTMTINLDSFIGSYVRFSSQFLYFSIYKTTVDGNTAFYVRNGSGLDYEEKYVYYDPGRSDNTYQLRYSGEYTEPTVFSTHIDFNYIGGWPTQIGDSEFYMQYQFDKDYVNYNPLARGLTYIRITGDNVQSPILRMDKAGFEGLMYRTITDVTYDPASFRTNPSTTITDIIKYGSSLTFGGNTYTVTDGNITLGTRQVSISKAVFDSIPVANGYANRINGNVVSTTATPSTIGFNGIWSAKVTSQSMESTTYTSTEWKPGQFGWDGIDTNFLLVGMFTSLAAFVGLGIYARRHGASVIPLMIVCGGAATLFFIMI